MFVGHTRFSLFQPGATAWHASKTSRFRTPVEYRNYLFSSERLDPRMDIFLTMTLPQLDIAVRDRALRHVVSYSEYLPSQYQKQLQNAARQYPWLVLDLCKVGQKPMNPLDLAPAGTIGAYRLDDDDILPADYFSRISAYVSEAHVGMFVSFASGLTAIYRDGGLYFTRRAYVPMIALGFLAIHRKNEDGTLTSPPATAHNISDRVAPVILDSRLPGYIWVRHLEQDTNLHAANLSEARRLKSLLKGLGERPPATDREEFQRFFPAVADRMHPEVGPGEVLQAPVSTPVEIPLSGLSLSIEPIRGQFEIAARIRPDREAVPRNALVTFTLETEDGTPVGSDCADQLREFGLPYSTRVGYYKYLSTEPGRFTTQVAISLPEGFLLTAITVRRWHRLETSLRIDEMTLTSRE